MSARRECVEGLMKHGKGSGSDPDDADRRDRVVGAGGERKRVLHIGDRGLAVDPGLFREGQHVFVDVVASDVGVAGASKRFAR